MLDYSMALDMLDPNIACVITPHPLVPDMRGIPVVSPTWLEARLTNPLVSLPNQFIECRLVFPCHSSWSCLRASRLYPCPAELLLGLRLPLWGFREWVHSPAASKSSIE